MSMRFEGIHMATFSCESFILPEILACIGATGGRFATKKTVELTLED